MRKVVEIFASYGSDLPFDIVGSDADWEVALQIYKASNVTGISKGMPLRL